MNRRLLVEGALGLSLLALTIGCSGDPSDAAVATAKGAAAGDPASGKGPGGRTATITLAESDVATVERGPVEDGTPITGNLRPIETVDVRARIEGDLTGVYVREGDHVHQGQLLARFESSAQESARRSAEADRASAQSDLSTAQWNLDQSEELYKAGAIAERDLRTAQQAVAAAKARLAAADAQLRTATLDAQYTVVTAPADGIIDKRSAEPGEHVGRGDVLLTLVRNQTLELAAAVPARQATTVRPAQVVHFVADGAHFDGRVARVSPTIDPASRSVTVYVQVPNPSGAIRGGTFATGRIVQRTIGDALLVRTAALHQAADDGHPYVYRIQGKSIEVAPVQIGIVDEAQGVAQVLGGLRSGDRVVVGNVGTLGEGMQVQIVGTEVSARSR